MRDARSSTDFSLFNRIIQNASGVFFLVSKTRGTSQWIGSSSLGSSHFYSANEKWRLINISCEGNVDFLLRFCKSHNEKSQRNESKHSQTVNRGFWWNYEWLWHLFFEWMRRENRWDFRINVSFPRSVKTCYRSGLFQCLRSCNDLWRQKTFVVCEHLRQPYSETLVH